MRAHHKDHYQAAEKSSKIAGKLAFHRVAKLQKRRNTIVASEQSKKQHNHI